MKQFLILFCIMTIAIAANAQKLPSIAVNGIISNATVDRMVLNYDNEHGRTIIDTIFLDGSGSFTYSTDNIRQPTIASLNARGYSFGFLALAPGYELQISADGESQERLLSSKSIRGKGAKSNRFFILRDQFVALKRDSTKYYNLSLDSLMAYLNNDQRIRDSIMEIAFAGEDVADPYFKNFDSLIRIENKFLKLSVFFTTANFETLTVQDRQRYLDQIISLKEQKEIYNERFFASRIYRSVMGSGWLTHHLKMNPGKYKGDHYKQMLAMATELYKGKLKDYVIYKFTTYRLNHFTKTEKELVRLQNDHGPYVEQIQTEDLMSDLDSNFLAAEIKIKSLTAGNPAPTFELKSETGSKHSLQDFRNKVVYLDLWASWCGPCREETPALIKLHEKYKKDSRVAFVSIAVHDALPNWKKALLEDRPTWLQLHDADGLIAKAYAANSIPRFVIIDKKGKIVNADAPRPSENRLERMLIKEMTKE